MPSLELIIRSSHPSLDRVDSPHPVVSDQHQASFSLDAIGNVVQMQKVLQDGSVVAATPTKCTTYTQLMPGYVLETVATDTHNSFELYYDASGDGIHTSVVYGSGTLVELVGITDQAI